MTEMKKVKKAFNKIKHYLEEAQKIVVIQHNAKKYKWAKSVDKNFNGMRRMVNDIDLYERRGVEGVFECARITMKIQCIYHDTVTSLLVVLLSLIIHIIIK